MSEKKECASQKHIFACSGAADVGEIAVRAACQLSRESVGKIYCLAGTDDAISRVVDKSRVLLQGAVK